MTKAEFNGLYDSLCYTHKYDSIEKAQPHLMAGLCLSYSLFENIRIVFICHADLLTIPKAMSLTRKSIAASPAD